ncbi:MAG: hypothetical protein RQ862_05730 [Candidatus Caldarchaeales archaeon]|nr:hypothetical protein [Candidatus Caldarchaeales archaeon]
MACFLLPLFIGILLLMLQRFAGEASEKLRIWVLDAMLLGGAGFLALEHLWAGEIVPWPPFLTSMASEADLAAFLNETLFVGGALTAAVTGAWALILLAANTFSKTRSLKTAVPARDSRLKDGHNNNRAPV